ncbi:IS110 family transposase [Hallella sp.]|uniref:IS110 family transposase n=1 Tax=Hallella sp. TaxID=2980186 RepID=UPI003078AF75
MTYIGIDISKATFVAAFPVERGYRTETFQNDAKGIRRFISKLSSDTHHCVMEATGNYCFLLLYLLDKAGIRASLVNPKKIKNYARVMLSVTKTDAKDACLIADFGERFKPEPYKFPSEQIMLLKQKKTVIRQFQKQLTATKNLHTSLEPLPVKDKKCIQSLKQTTAFLEKQIKYMQQEMEEVVSEVFARQLKALTSIKGIGVTLASALIIATGGFTYFDNAKQLSRFAGICPTIERSGTSINIRGHINRNGDENLRSMLYVAAWSASRHNKACRECYQRLRSNGKSGKLAMIAVANKLIRQAFAVVTSNSSYIDGYISTKPNVDI